MLRIKEVVKDLRCFNYMNYALTLTIKSTIYVSQPEHVVLSHIRRDVLLLAQVLFYLPASWQSIISKDIQPYNIYSKPDIEVINLYYLDRYLYCYASYSSKYKKMSNTIYMPRIGVVLIIIMIFDSRRQIFVAVSHCLGFQMCLYFS